MFGLVIEAQLSAAVAGVTDPGTYYASVPMPSSSCTAAWGAQNLTSSNWVKDLSAVK
jgi:hypothetical protein